MLKLRPYQENAVEQIREAYRSNFRAPLLVLPTGGGKTVIFSHIANNTAKKGKRCLILVHRVELLRQTADALKKDGATIGLINPLYTPNLAAPIQVASVQTLVKRLHWQFFENNPFDLIITDEAHHVTASTYLKIHEAFPNAFKLGVTATPVRSDGKGLGIQDGGLYDKIIVGVSVSELISMGFLVQPKIYAPKEKIDLSGVHTRGGDYARDELEAVVNRPTITGSAVEHYKRFCPGTPAVVFCVSVKHAETVAAEFRAAGFVAESADGSMEDETRRRILNGLGNGSVEVVCSCDLISEGTDIPKIGAAFLLRPTQSTGLYIQQVGRALRPADGKNCALIFDHVGNVTRHGLPDEERAWSLVGEAKPKRGKKEKDDAPKISQCEECYFVHAPALTCPECGFVYQIKTRPEPKTVGGELAELSERAKIEIKRQRAAEMSRCKTLADLQEFGKAKGYKPGWAEHIYKARQTKRLVYDG